MKNPWEVTVENIRDERGCYFIALLAWVQAIDASYGLEVSHAELVRAAGLRFHDMWAKVATFNIDVNAAVGAMGVLARENFPYDLHG